jgi:4-oxalocrotonate tautomerase
MPHAIIKMYPGKTEAQKQALAAEITAAIVKVNGCGEGAVSVAIEDIQPEDWTATVYVPEIVDKSETIYKKPGYDPR